VTDKTAHKGTVTVVECEPPDRDPCGHEPQPLPPDVPAEYAGVCLTCLARDGIRLPDGTVQHIDFEAGT
jgi:hypothetical protein